MTIRKALPILSLVLSVSVCQASMFKMFTPPSAVSAASSNKGRQGGAAFSLSSQSETAYSEGETGALLPQVHIPGLAYAGSGLWCGVNDVDVYGDYLFASYINGLVVFDISNRADPQVVRRIFFDSAFVGNVAVKYPCSAPHLASVF